MSGEEDEKNTSVDGSVHINLKVKNQDGNETFFRIKRNTPLKKLMNAYCEHKSVGFNSLTFLLDGRRIRGGQTPDKLKMEDGDEIDAMEPQIGGSTVAWY